ncbi:hypothetical protein C5167_019516 [Papaver somniferum]|uniref:Uncharacterized protein n=1 Tax=Papaver somniferum TaxID=3469 RepID=A0A4Y7IUB6_PAPSO|nr:hypothetical protein C5167_019516 [Papaver somniferum]
MFQLDTNMIDEIGSLGKCNVNEERRMIPQPNHGKEEFIIASDSSEVLSGGLITLNQHGVPALQFEVLVFLSKTGFKNGWEVGVVDIFYAPSSLLLGVYGETGASGCSKINTD